MNAQLILTLIVFNTAAYALAFAASTVLVDILGGPWRRAVGAHWTERARLAFAPGYAVLWLVTLLPPATALIGGSGLGVLEPRLQERMLGYWTTGVAAFAGVMTVRYRWLRELWGERVTLRSWLAGCLVVVLALLPHLLVVALLLFLMPESWDARSGVMFGAGVVAVAFFARGGGVLLLRLLGVVGPAQLAVREMVEQLAHKMNVPGRVKVFEIQWAQVNAVAWVLYRAVGFSRPLLDLMAQDEVRAVAAHELAHLIEPRWVRAVRVAHMFAYLAVVPVIKVGGSGGIAAGYLLTMAILLGYTRFTRRFEQRADRLEREAIADTNAYMRSLIKLHEANVTPAVMPGSQSHPHLYDRLLAGGIQPTFPRPMAPSRAKPLLVVLLAVILNVVFLFGMVVAAGVAVRLVEHWR